MSPTRRGLWVYCDSSDVIHVERSIPTLRRCGAVGAIAMIEGITPTGAQRMPLDRVRRFVDAAKAAGLDVTLCAFPDVRADLIASRDWLADACEALGCHAQLDAEPRPPAHWTPALVEPWLSIYDLSITTTRVEAPRLGSHNRTMWAQLEQQTSVATLSKALAIFSRTTPLEQIVLVTGALDQAPDQGGRRTIEEVHADLTRCAPQARVSGAHAVWSAHTIGPAEADALREWSAEVF